MSKVRNANDEAVFIKSIRTSTNIDLLTRIVWDEQADYWYDPCGKSGFDINRSLTRPAAVALERIARIKGWDGSGGIK